MKGTLCIETDPKKVVAFEYRADQIVTIKFHSDGVKISFDKRTIRPTPSETRKAQKVNRKGNFQNVELHTLPKDESDLSLKELTDWYVLNWNLSNSVSLVLKRNRLWPQRVATMTFEDLNSIRKIGPISAMQILQNRPSLTPLQLHA